MLSVRGHVYTMGSNSEGRLGIGDKNMRQSSSPCLVEDIMSFNCFQVSCGWGHTVAVMGLVFYGIDDLKVLINR